MEVMIAAHAEETSHLNLDENDNPLSFRTALAGPHRDKWLAALCDEYIRLTEETGTISWNAWDSKPKKHKATYCSMQVKEKMGEDGVIKYRVRLTVGGDRVEFHGERSSTTASLETLKVMLNGVVSDSGRKWSTCDIKDFYLGTHMCEEDHVWMYIPEKDIPLEIRQRYDIEIRNGLACVRIHKGMYGLPHAGKIAQDRLIEHLERHGFHQCKRTQCLFRHESRDIAFMLVVDDFGISYKNQSDLSYFFDILNLQYKITTDISGSKYLGITIEQKEDQISISMPGYVSAALARFKISKLPDATHSPILARPVIHGHQFELEPPAGNPSPDHVKKRIQQIIGVFLYYARAIDESMLTALNKLASQQATPTEELENDVDRFLQYAATYPSTSIIFKPSDMRLFVHSDASYLSETKSRSRAGGFFFLGNNGESGYDSLNGGLGSLSQIIPMVVSSAAESEYAALFIVAQKACIFQNILNDLGYPQVATEIWCDNTTATNAANKSIRIRRLQSTAMRFHWIQDRIALGQFVVLWGAGISNLGDFFTKILPSNHHRLRRKWYVTDVVNDTNDIPGSLKRKK
jgi:hypothetical protein